MQTTDVRRPGYLTALDIAVAPQAAFSNLRATPTWVWAFVIAAVCGMIGSIAVSPATLHVLALTMPEQLAKSPQLAGLPPAQRTAQIAQIIAATGLVTRLVFIAVPFVLAIGCALQALIMLIANAIGKGDGTFAKYWALATNTAVVGTGISSLVLALIVLLRGTDSFSAAADIANSLPGPGMFVPAGAKAAAAFFGVLNIFSLWNAVLLAAGMTAIGRVPRAVAVGAAAVIFFGTGLLPLVSALFQK